MEQESLQGRDPKAHIANITLNNYEDKQKEWNELTKFIIIIKKVPFSG